MSAALRSLTMVFVLLAAAVCASAQAPVLADYAAAIERTSTEQDGYRVVVGHLSRELRLPAEVLRAERAQTGLSWGELLLAHHIAARAQAPLNQVVAERQGGKAWEEIARGHAVDLDELAAAMQRSQGIVDRRAEDKSRQPEGAQMVSPPSTGPLLPGILR